MSGVGMYYSVVFVSALFAWIGQLFLRGNKKKGQMIGKIFMFFSFMTMFIFLGTRVCGVGVDDNSYRHIFERTNEMGVLRMFTSTSIEPGYLLLNKIVGLFTNDFQVMIGLLAALSLGFMYKAILRESEHLNMFLAIAIFGLLVYPYFFGILRLSLAVSISFYASKFLVTGDRKKYNWLIVLAGSIHYSALILLLMNLLIKKPMNSINLRKFYIILLTIVPVCFFVISKIATSLIGGRYAGYTINSEISVSIADFDKLPIIIFGLIFLRMTKEDSPNFPLYLTLYSSSLIITIYSLFIGFGRAEWYFNIYICMILPMVVSIVSKKPSMRIAAIIIVPMILLYGYLYSNHLIDEKSHIVYFDKYESILIGKLS